jgi:hypothetical protein
VLELQETGSLPPEAVSLLMIGPNFSITPNEIPKMEIMTEIEKCCISLIRQGKTREAENLRHQSANILIHASIPKSNLTSQQKQSLSKV